MIVLAPIPLPYSSNAMNKVYHVARHLLNDAPGSCMLTLGDHGVQEGVVSHLPLRPSGMTQMRSYPAKGEAKHTTSGCFLLKSPCREEDSSRFRLEHLRTQP